MVKGADAFVHRGNLAYAGDVSHTQAWEESISDLSIIISIGTLTLKKVLRQIAQYVQVLAMEIVSMLQPFIDAFKTRSSFLMQFLGPPSSRPFAYQLLTV